ncbi:lasso peptide biosynthesis B2 protein [Phenylobacterium sp.]|uniref:lasso peptide biosynthesis B2 protein n=1 Tax=Phenylobacterium sp. TaxID=1871053 RepID=UPI003BA8E024
MQNTVWRLTPRTHLAFVGPDLVVLDVEDNAYFCLPGAVGSIRQLDGGDVVFEDADLAEQFATAGFLSSAPAEPRSTRRLPDRPSADLQALTAASIDRHAMAGMLGAFAGMLRHYYGKPFSHLIGEAARGALDPGAAERPPSMALTERVAAFGHLLPWAPFQGECLYRSFMLLRFLRSAGHDARWVFGVRTWPFQAHCWLQAGGTALDDAAERVAPFTPILAV